MHRVLTLTKALNLLISPRRNRYYFRKYAWVNKSTQKIYAPYTCNNNIRCFAYVSCITISMHTNIYCVNVWFIRISMHTNIFYLLRDMHYIHMNVNRTISNHMYLNAYKYFLPLTWYAPYILNVIYTWTSYVSQCIQIFIKIHMLRICILINM